MLRGGGSGAISVGIPPARLIRGDGAPLTPAFCWEYEEKKMATESAWCRSDRAAKNAHWDLEQRSHDVSIDSRAKSPAPLERRRTTDPAKTDGPAFFQKRVLA